MSVSTQNGLLVRDCDACLEPKLANRISHPALTQEINISNSRPVIQYEERLYATCSFRVMSVGTRKMSYQKEVAIRV